MSHNSMICLNLSRLVFIEIALHVVTSLIDFNVVFPQIVYNRVARGMMHDDRITFAMLLCRIYLRGLTGLVVLLLTAAGGGEKKKDPQLRDMGYMGGAVA